MILFYSQLSFLQNTNLFLLNTWQRFVDLGLYKNIRNILVWLRGFNDCFDLCRMQNIGF